MLILDERKRGRKKNKENETFSERKKQKKEEGRRS